MDYVLVPRLATPATPGSAMVSIIAFGDAPTDDPQGQDVTVAAGNERQSVGGWRRVFEEHGTWCAHITLDLEADRQEVKLFVNGALADRAEATRLRDGLSRPLRVVLGSCFEPTDSRQLKQALDHLEGPRPDIKLLCGDQVYLDPTWPRSRTWGKAGHAQRTLGIYRETWKDPNFSALLKCGTNVFCPDDHDLWDNYTLDIDPSQQERERFAKGAIRAFQCDAPLQRFNVGPLRFLVVDTRQERTDPHHTTKKSTPQFVDAEILEQVISWVECADGPGVLVLGQPLLGERGRIWKVGYGSDIPNYAAQFERLANAIINAPCSMVILSGDVHWGRVAHGKNLRGHAIIEVISSPLGLSPVRALAGVTRRWLQARESLSTEAHPEGCRIETERLSRVTGAQFATLDFRANARTPGGVSLEVQQWRASDGGRACSSFPFDL